jgi:hypothetical protein
MGMFKLLRKFFATHCNFLRFLEKKLQEDATFFKCYIRREIVTFENKLYHLQKKCYNITGCSYIWLFAIFILSNILHLYVSPRCSHLALLRSGMWPTPARTSRWAESNNNGQPLHRLLLWHLLRSHYSSSSPTTPAVNGGLIARSHIPRPATLPPLHAWTAASTGPPPPPGLPLNSPALTLASPCTSTWNPKPSRTRCTPTSPKPKLLRMRYFLSAFSGLGFFDSFLCDFLLLFI